MPFTPASVVTLGDLSEREYQGDKPLTIRCDNQGAIHLSRNPVSHKRSKHIEIRYHFVRERVQDGTLKFTYVDTKLNISDILTKPTSKAVFTFLRDKLLWDRDPSAEWPSPYRSHLPWPTDSSPPA